MGKFQGGALQKVHPLRPNLVIAGLDPAIHSTDPAAWNTIEEWMPGSSPGMTFFGYTGSHASKEAPLTAGNTLGAPSVDPREVEKFSRLAAEWWDPHGKFAVLHKFNPVRIAYVREQATAWLARDPHVRAPLAGLRLLDIGCGGGLLSEPMARLGAEVVGIDPSEA